jgi:RimJ/RimL family protein N-acetyltransferase
MNTEALMNLTIKTQRLLLRLTNNEELALLARVASEGIQSPNEPHFQSDELYDRPAEEIEKSLNEHVSKYLSEWNKNDWQLPFAVFYEDKPIGMITMYAKDFPIARGFGCGYWIGLAYQGKGLGTEMLRAILSLGFDRLYAREAYVGAWSDNEASKRIMEKLGFEFNGEYWMVRQGKAVKDIRMRLPQEKWIKIEDISIHGLKSCREFFIT